ncbi:MAG: hypothetical protein WCW84_14675 [Sulfurimonas sp.]
MRYLIWLFLSASFFSEPLSTFNQIKKSQAKYLRTIIKLYIASVNTINSAQFSCF